MTDIIKNFWKDEEGATAIEYGLIAGLISVAIIAGVSLLGDQLKQVFTYITTTLGSSADPAAGIPTE